MARSNKLTIRDLQTIYRLLNDGVKQQAIAREFKVRQSLISFYKHKHTFYKKQHEKY